MLRAGAPWLLSAWVLVQERAAGQHTSPSGSSGYPDLRGASAWLVADRIGEQPVARLLLSPFPFADEEIEANLDSVTRVAPHGLCIQVVSLPASLSHTCSLPPGHT